MQLLFPNGVKIKVGGLLHGSKQADVFKCAVIQDGALVRKAVVKIQTATAEQDSLHQESLALGVLGSLQGVPQLLAYGEVTWQGNVRPALVTEYYEGYELAQLRKKLIKKRFNTQQTINLLLGASAVLEKVHATGWAHGDIKMSNCMVGPAGVSIVDWATARNFKATRNVLPPSRVGTLQYASIEHVQHKLPNSRSDIYSLGVVAATIHYGTWITPRFRIEERKPIERTKDQIVEAIRSYEALKYEMLPASKNAQELKLRALLKQMTHPHPQQRAEMNVIRTNLA